MLTLPRQSEILTNSDLRAQFEQAIRTVYPLESHLYEHGDMATEALHQLWLRYSENATDAINVLPWQNPDKPYKGYFFQTRDIVENMRVTIPYIEALSWFLVQEPTEFESIMRLIPSRYSEINKWALTMTAFYLTYGHTNLKDVNIRGAKSFPFQKFKEDIKSGRDNHYDRIKRTPMRITKKIIEEKYKLSIPQNVTLSISGLPTAVITSDPRFSLNTFSTAFIHQENFTDLRAEILRQIR